MLERIIAILLEPVTDRLELLMADVTQVLADVRKFKTELDERLDTIDDVIERLRGQVAEGQVDQAIVDELATEVSDLRTSTAAVNPEDPSGDDTVPAPANG